MIYVSSQGKCVRLRVRDGVECGRIQLKFDMEKVTSPTILLLESFKLHLP